MKPDTVSPRSAAPRPGPPADPAGEPLDVVALAESLSSFIALLDGDRISYLNPVACALLARPSEALVGREFWELLHVDDREAARRRERSRQDGQPCADRLEVRLLQPDGGLRWIEYSIDEVELAGRRRTLVTGHDVSERRRTEAELRDSEERFRNLCSQAPVMLLSFDEEKRVREVSNYWLDSMGYRREEVIGQEGWSFLSEESRERLRREVEEGPAGRRNVIRNLPMEVVRKDGSTLEVLTTSVAEFDDAGRKTGAICVQIDPSCVRQAEEALRESAERYRALVEHAPEAITVLDVDENRFVDANAHAETLYGFTREQLLGMGPLDFCSELQAGGRASCEVIEDEHRRVLEGETTVFEFTHVTADGRELHCQTRLSRLPAAGRRLIRATTTDITELKQLQERMRNADRLAAAGALAAGVAHEIGNPLMALSMAAQSLERRSCNEYTQSKLALIREHSERISRIVRQMSELARPQSKQRAPCELGRIARRAVEMVRYDERARGAQVEDRLSDSLPEVLAVEDELSQVCINLALNAFDAMRDNPADRPRTLSLHAEERERSVVLRFEDTGPGVPEELRERLFEPFFTTKSAGHGSGLGLSVSLRILEEHEGSLRLGESESGAVFEIELPRLPESTP